MPILFIVFIFVGWLAYEIRKSTRDSENDSRRFWNRESEALLTPRKSIADVDFISIPSEVIPDEILITEDNPNELFSKINALSNELRVLSTKEIADLSEYTNTDLRIKYGSPNFTRLSTADSNFTRLVQLMPVLVNALLEAGFNASAKTLLDYCEKSGISCKALTALRERV